MTQAARRLTEPEVQQRRSDYRASFAAQRRAATDPQFMELLTKKLAELDERYKTARA